MTTNSVALYRTDKRPSVNRRFQFPASARRVKKKGTKHTVLARSLLYTLPAVPALFHDKERIRTTCKVLQKELNRTSTGSGWEEDTSKDPSAITTHPEMGTGRLPFRPRCHRRLPIIPRGHVAVFVSFVRHTYTHER